MWRFLLILAVLPVFLLLLYGDWKEGPASAQQSDHLLDHYYVQEFTEDILNSPGVSIPVYDCSSNVQNHPTAIQAAVNALNSTGVVRFVYVPGGTACITSGLDEGFPLDDGRVSVYHPAPAQQPDTANYWWRQYFDSFRLNDIGTEGDVGMYPLRFGRIRIRAPAGPSDPNQFNSHTTDAIKHELGHAAGLADLYYEDGHLQDWFPSIPGAQTALYLVPNSP